MRVSRLRDLSILATEPPLVLATDSTGSIGSKEHDALQVAPEVTGYFLARVPLMEILCIGAEPLTYVVTSSNEMEPTGAAILAGVRKAFASFDMAIEQENGSTEENMPSSMTASGITLLATLPEGWQNPEALAGDQLYLLGWPQVGQQVLDHPENLVSFEEVLALRKDPRVGVMVPLGSRGIASELDQLGLSLEAVGVVPWHESGGPASAIIFSAKSQLVDLPTQAPLRHLGVLRE